MTITDEMVEKARKIIGDDYSGPLAPIAIRAALEAVAPMIRAPLQREIQTLRNIAVAQDVAKDKLIAQGMREALAIARKFNDGEPDSVDCIETAILARAQELDPDTSLYGAAKYGPGHDIR